MASFTALIILCCLATVGVAVVVRVVSVRLRAEEGSF